MSEDHRVMPETTPVVLAESSTTLQEDLFTIQGVPEGYPEVRCNGCEQMVTPVEDGDDLNTLIRLAYAHAQECDGAQWATMVRDDNEGEDKRG